MSDSTTRFRIGHWTNDARTTGCTVILFNELTPCVADVRGGAPGTRETDLLAAGSSVRSADAVLLAGGSAFGLSAADGVVRFLAERGRGYPTSSCPVPIVPAAVVFDNPASIDDAPGTDAGYDACRAAVEPSLAESGSVGVGRGCTHSKLWGPETVSASGVGIEAKSDENWSVTAIVAVNSVGAPVDQIGSGDSRLCLSAVQDGFSGREATTIGVVVVDGPTDYGSLERCSIAAHDALARTIAPTHTALDGDMMFVCGPSRGEVSIQDSLKLQVLTELAVEEAVRQATTR